MNLGQTQCDRSHRVVNNCTHSRKVVRTSSCVMIYATYLGDRSDRFVPEHDGHGAQDEHLDHTATLQS